MVDSINLCIGIYVRIKHLTELGITYKPFKVKKENKKSINGIEFKYKNIKFVYMIAFQKLRIETHTYDVLQKTDITLSDKDTYKDIVNKVINEIVETENFDYVTRADLTRFDYCVDIVKDKEGIKQYRMLLKKHPKKYKRIIRNDEYETSNYLSTPKSQIRINMYEKEECEKDKLNKIKIKLRTRFNEELLMKKDDLEIKLNLYRDVLRSEVQLNKDKLKRNSKVKLTAKKTKKIKKRRLDVYWSKESMEEEFFEYLEGYLYKGDYFHLLTAYNMIQDSDYSNSWKTKLSGFIVDIAVNKIDDLTELKLYSTNTRKDYIEKLNQLNINPITLDERFTCYKVDNLWNKAKEIAKEKYFI